MTDATSPIWILDYGLMAVWFRRLVFAGGLLTFVVYEGMTLPHCEAADEYLTSDKGMQLTVDNCRTFLTTGRKIWQCEPLRNSVNLLRTLIP